MQSTDALVDWDSAGGAEELHFTNPQVLLQPWGHALRTAALLGAAQCFQVVLAGDPSGENKLEAVCTVRTSSSLLRAKAPWKKLRAS